MSVGAEKGIRAGGQSCRKLRDTGDGFLDGIPFEQDGRGGNVAQDGVFGPVVPLFEFQGGQVDDRIDMLVQVGFPDFFFRRMFCLAPGRSGDGFKGFAGRQGGSEGQEGRKGFGKGFERNGNHSD